VSWFAVYSAVLVLLAWRVFVLDARSRATAEALDELIEAVELVVDASANRAERLELLEQLAELEAEEGGELG
jgi:hypothetical protein